MEALRELVFIVARDKRRAIEHIDDPSIADSKIRSFYDHILNSKIETDEDAAGILYDAPKSVKSSAYQKLKRQLTERLLNTLFFIKLDDPAHNKRQQAYYRCYRQWAAAKILFGKNARRTGIKLCHRILREAKKYEFTELVLDIARMLRLHYGTQEGDLKKFDQYSLLFQEYERIWIWENKAEELYAELIVRYVNSKATKKAIHKRAMAYYEQLEQPMEQSDSYALHFCGLLIEVIIHSSLNDYARVLKVCDKALRFFEQKKYTASMPMQVFFYQKMVCHIQLKQYEQGALTAKKCLKFFEAGTYNWFKFHELYFLLSMHTKKYQQAYQVFSRALEHKRFRFLPAGVRELWRIYEAFIHYLVEIGKVKAAGDERFNNFRLGKFLNETPIFSKDKRGMNIPILVIQILFRIVRKQYDEAIDRIEAVEKYCSRYLKKDDTFRSNSFIKLLLQVPIAGFHKAAVKRREKKYLSNLHNVPLDMAGQTHEVEIIPYEELWQLVLDSLDHNIYKQD